MSLENPPPVDAWAGPTRQTQQWTNNLPSDVLELDPKAVRSWHDSLTVLAHTVSEQVTAAQALRIDVGGVGRFLSATETAKNINESGEAIRRRLNEFAELVTALQNFSEAAYNALIRQDG